MEKIIIQTKSKSKKAKTGVLIAALREHEQVKQAIVKKKNTAIRRYL